MRTIQSRSRRSQLLAGFRGLTGLTGWAGLRGLIRLRGLGGLAAAAALLAPGPVREALGAQNLTQGRGAGPAPVEPADPAFEYAPVRYGTRLAFPRDHGSHPDYRTEWWYLTGWLESPGGFRAPFQVTFFRTRTRHPTANPSAFAATQLIFAHAALGWPGRTALAHAERASRALPGLAGAESGDTHVWLGPPSDRWLLERTADDRYRTRILAREFTLDLGLKPDAGPWLQGESGTSRKASDPARASHYYSRPQLEVSGTVRGQHLQTVQGRAWFDHEWSSELLDPQAVGWDWVGLNLDDGSALMAFRIRDAQGATLWREAAYRPAAHPIEPQAARNGLRPVFEVMRIWRSPRTGARYPVELRLHLHDPHRSGFDRVLHLMPFIDDQELDTRASTGTVYWEGGVTVFEAAATPQGTSPGGAGRRLGQGHLELTGYAGPLRL